MRVNQTKSQKNLALINYKANAQEKCVKHDFEGSETVFKNVPILNGYHFPYYTYYFSLLLDYKSLIIKTISSYNHLTQVKF